MTPGDPAAASSEPASGLRRAAEEALRRLGYTPVRPGAREASAAPEFWVQESGVPRRTYPVFVDSSPRAPQRPRFDAWIRSSAGPQGGGHRAIVVVPNDRAAEEAWNRVRVDSGEALDSEVSILVVPPHEGRAEQAHWHARIEDPRKILELATGIVVGLFQRTQAIEGSGQIDFEEILEVMRTRFRVDVHRSLHVQSDEDALFILYQLALRDSYAPGDPGANLHLLVLRPTGPAARLPWFAG